MDMKTVIFAFALIGMYYAGKKIGHLICDVIIRLKGWNEDQYGRFGWIYLHGDIDSRVFYILYFRPSLWYRAWKNEKEPKYSRISFCRINNLTVCNSDWWDALVRNLTNTKQLI